LQPPSQTKKNQPPPQQKHEFGSLSHFFCSFSVILFKLTIIQHKSITLYGLLITLIIISRACILRCYYKDKFSKIFKYKCNSLSFGLVAQQDKTIKSTISISQKREEHLQMPLTGKGESVALNLPKRLLKSTGFSAAAATFTKTWSSLISGTATLSSNLSTLTSP
jgi:hypothetical protein